MSEHKPGYDGTFRAWLSYVKEEYKLSNTKIAKLANCHPTTVGNILSGDIPTPSENMKEKIQFALISNLNLEKKYFNEDKDKHESSIQSSSFGSWLESEMRGKNISNLRLAEEVGCHPSTIRFIVTGRIKAPSKEMVSKLTEAINSVLPIQVKENAETESSFDGKLDFFTDFNPFDETTIPNKPGVYALFGPTDVVLYVGQSNNVKNRMRQHSEKKWFIDQIINTGLCFYEGDKERRLRLEKILIKFLKSNAWINKIGRY